MVGMFCRVEIETKLNKTKAIVCMPVFIWGQMTQRIGRVLGGLGRIPPLGGPKADREATS